MRIRINLNDGVTYGGYNYVVVDAPSVRDARLTATRATGQAVARQGAAFIHGFIGYKSEPRSDIEYRHHPGPGSWFETWVPEGAEFADTPDMPVWQVNP
jgi:hypothetical protein